jgi:hypothetical protein
MIAEVMLPKTATETAGKDITELYDEERQGRSLPPSSLRPFRIRMVS